MSLYSQQWGLYTLYAPSNSTQAFLVDTNGTTYKTWTFGSSAKTGFSNYLLPGDTLLRPVARSGNSLHGGGLTGEVQKVTWDGTVVWDYTYSSSSYCLHHDVCPMPNGNVLLTCYEVKSSTDASNAGCSSPTTIWSEKLMEVHPTGATTAIIVWEWKLWDHLCQSYSSTKPNYVTSISENPQLMNINYNVSQDWIHMNGIDYNADLDQITFSSRTMNEIYVIDHSTTTAEAATHTGGNSGKGGDFLYRWGNPAAYGLTGTTNFDVVHDAHWISSDDPTYPNYLCGFNNEGGAGGKSSVDIFSPPYDGFNYSYTAGSVIPPSTYAYRYSDTQKSTSNGSSQKLPNGNILLCMSTVNTISEINSAGTTLWTKTGTGSPANAIRYDMCYVRGPIANASTPMNSVCTGDVFELSSSGVSVTETSPNYSYSWSCSSAGFTSSLQNPSITPTTAGEYTYVVTITNTELNCWDTASVTLVVENCTGIDESAKNRSSITVFPNPAQEYFYIENISVGCTITIVDKLGRRVYTSTAKSDKVKIQTDTFAKGLYFITIQNKEKTEDIKLIVE